MTIHLLTRIEGVTLLVFYTSAHAWQFRVLNPVGEVFGSKQIFYSKEAAEREGRAWIKSKCSGGDKGSRGIAV